MSELVDKQLGDFEVVRELGRGGMGVVFEARQQSLNRRVALKVLAPGLGLTQRAVERFHREAEAAAKLHHTNIVPVYATGEANGFHFYAMELIEGSSLDRVMAQFREQKGSKASAMILPATLAATGPYVEATTPTPAGSGSSSGPSSGGPRRAHDLYREIAARRLPAWDGFNALVILYILGRPAEAAVAARDLLNDPRRLPLIRPELIVLPLRFAAGELSEVRFLNAAKSRSGTLCNAHFTIALKRLSEGDRAGAREHFEACLATRVFNYTP